jgi:glycosyltransferase involved in cell wall biosynthesis
LEDAKTIYEQAPLEHLGRKRTLESAEPKKDISIILPAHNEASQIEKCVREVDHAARTLSDSYEIIVSEDGSTDGTDAIVKDLAATIRSLTLQHFPVRLGKGKALKNALNSTHGDVIVFMDVDLATSLTCLPQVVKKVSEQGGLVIGSRHVAGSRVQRRVSRTLSSLAYNTLVRALFRDNVHDHQCGFKAMRRDVAEAMGGVRSNGFFFDTEMILRCKKSGFPVCEVGVEWSEKRAKSSSKVNVFRDGARMGMDLLRYRFRLDGTRRR